MRLFSMRLLYRLARWYNWAHWSVSLAGNICFLTGSILFMNPSTRSIGSWFFVIGASGMLVGRIGSTVIEMEYKKLEAERERVKKNLRGPAASQNSLEQ